MMAALVELDRVSKAYEEKAAEFHVTDLSRDFNIGLVRGPLRAQHLLELRNRHSLCCP
jgi:hypothetical protein